jgi:hypothetical protein
VLEEEEEEEKKEWVIVIEWHGMVLLHHVWQFGKCGPKQ